MTLRERILAAAPVLPFEDIEFPPDSGITLRITGLTSRERDLFEDETGLGGSDFTADNIRARLLARTARDPETGEKAFLPGDVAALGEMPADATQHAFNVAMRLSCFTKQDVAELEKNSASAPTND